MSGLACALLLAAPFFPPAAARAAAPQQAGAAQPEPPQPLITFSAGPQLASRKVSYTDALTKALLPYQSGSVWMWTAALAVYPASNRGLPVVSDVGFFGGMSRSLAAPQLVPAGGGAGFDTRFISWEAGARLRLVLAGRDWAGLSLRYTSARHDFSGTLQTTLLLPSGTTQAWEPGLDVQLPLGPLSLSLAGAFIVPATRDTLAQAFPRSTRSGVDARAGLALQPFAHVEVRLEGRYSRLVYSLNPLPHDPYVAGGAVDASTSVDLALAFRG